MEDQNSQQQPMQSEQPMQSTPQPMQSSGPSMSEDDKKDVEENKVMAALSYLGILVLIPLLVKRDSKFAQFHAKQGLIFLIIFVIGWVIFWIPIIGWLVWLAVVIADIIGLIQALSGKYWEAPVIGDWAKKLKI